MITYLCVLLIQYYTYNLHVLQFANGINTIILFKLNNCIGINIYYNMYQLV